MIAQYLMSYNVTYELTNKPIVIQLILDNSSRRRRKVAFEPACEPETRSLRNLFSDFYFEFISSNDENKFCELIIRMIVTKYAHLFLCDANKCGHATIGLT